MKREPMQAFPGAADDQMSRSLFQLEATPDANAWRLPVERRLCAGKRERPFMYGGVGLAAAVSAAEQSCRRPVNWATAQYISFARPGAVVELGVSVLAGGGQTSQVAVQERVDGQLVIIVHAALGARAGADPDQWLCAPAAPAPQDCPAVRHLGFVEGGVESRFEVRLAEGRYPDGSSLSGRGESGRVRLWIRSKEGCAVTAQLLSVVADFVSVAANHAVGRYVGAHSLDNTIRFGDLHDSEWILCDAQIEALNHGILHAAMRLFSEEGRLLATASQSLILRG